jgi:hypothetical protein
MVSGAARIGKSRLVAELEERAREPNALVLRRTKVVGRDRVKALVAERRDEVVFDCVAVAVPRAFAKIDHRAVKPARGGVSEAQTAVWGAPLTSMTAGEQLVAQR